MIPEIILDKINKEADDHAVIMSEGLNSHAFNMIKDTFRQAAIWGAFELDKWISVKNGLPEKVAANAINSKKVLCYCYVNPDHGISFYKIIFYNYSTNRWYLDYDKLFLKEVTHYQYLPKPPKDI